ncbi:bifunctional peptidase and arginyl-hydroxylase JMJD5 [Sabethes cyaneus]|uniref:bifunctional peptidase and arginyl-hydroxylase JMJD5 n=1 Tax=Sabethes cyaneus TaxID=53552 RepID=UPI00237EC633|nr:bifunctional peptidase and arginyl-hydroxylase JMJD5 [Sabethes cyaneus]
MKSINTSLYSNVLKIVMDFPNFESVKLGEREATQIANCNLRRIGILYDLVNCNLHTGEWSKVPLEECKMFRVLSALRIFYMLLCSEDNVDQLDDVIYVADFGNMLGSPVYIDYNGENIDLLKSIAMLLKNAKKNKEETATPVKRAKISDDCTEEVCEVPILHRPSLEYFGSEHYAKAEPALLRDVIDDWPALHLWSDPNYLIEKAGETTVPVEIGSTYSSDDWSQQLVKFKDFVVNSSGLCLTAEASSQRNVPVYLAQYELFDQIPELRADIFVPDYIGRTDVNPRIKAWLGPKGTVSPLHTDPSHNLLCQVFGSKTVILASPGDTPNLYPHDHFMLSNTSQVDAKNVNYERFPLTRKVHFRRLGLRRGDVLYIPPGWWHYVESRTPSFSVSFWFD